MKILNTMLGRQAIAAALVLSLAIPMSVGAFAEEPAAAAAADDTVVAGYLPPQDESVMLQGEIALHSGDVAVGETDPAYGGYGAPEGDPIQGDIMLISADEAKTTEAHCVLTSPCTEFSAFYREFLVDFLFAACRHQSSGKRGN